MMTLEEYASDVGKTVEEIMALCDKLGLDYEDKDTLLDDTAIVLLDNNMNEPEEEIEEIDEDVEEALDKEYFDEETQQYKDGHWEAWDWAHFNLPPKNRIEWKYLKSN